jgi:hypothetical protein
VTTLLYAAPGIRVIPDAGPEGLAELGPQHLHLSVDLALGEFLQRAKAVILRIKISCRDRKIAANETRVGSAADGQVNRAED